MADGRRQKWIKKPGKQKDYNLRPLFHKNNSTTTANRTWSKDYQGFLAELLLEIGSEQITRAKCYKNAPV